jgi:hypothetical protein
MVSTRVLQVSQCRQRTLWLSVAVLASGWLVLCLWFCSHVQGQELDVKRDLDRTRLHEPIYRVANPVAVPELNQLAATAGTATAVLPAVARHALDPALELARESLSHIEQHVYDYTCTLVKRERVQGELLDHEFIACKIRHARQAEAQIVPFAVYLGFRKPDSMRGREVIYVDGHNEGKIVAHEGGLKGRFLPTVDLLPTSALALRGNRYPITEIGIMTLTRRLIEKGERDRRNGDCEVRMVDGAKVKDRQCTMLEVVHPEQRPHYDFHLARVFLDKELKMPIRYEAYGWPTSAGEKPPLLEEYTYVDVKVNVGLTDEDFDRNNPKYRF